MPNPYSPHGMYAAPLDSKRCVASIWYSMGNGSGNKQCDRPGVYKVGKHKWCKQHARQFPVDEQPAELRPKRVEGARWWPGQTVYWALNRWGELKLMTGVVKSVRKDGLELADRADLSNYKAVASYKVVFPTEAEAWAHAAKCLRAKASNLEKELKAVLKDADLAEKRASK